MLRLATLSRSLPLLGALSLTSAMARAPETITPNDNRHLGASLAGKVFSIKLEAREGIWRPRATAVARFQSRPGPKKGSR